MSESEYCLIHNAMLAVVVSFLCWTIGSGWPCLILFLFWGFPGEEKPKGIQNKGDIISETPENYGEPWTEKEGTWRVCNKDGIEVVGFSFAVQNERGVKRRIVVCVNACAGIPTETLEKYQPKQERQQ